MNLFKWKDKIEYIIFMPSTTIHFPEKILKRLDEAAREHGMSRNRYVLKACEEALVRDEGKWPEGFFSADMKEEDLSILRKATMKMDHEIYSHGRNRGAPLL